MNSNEIARAKLEKALQLIEDGQGMIGTACGELSRLKGGIRQYRLASKLYDKVKATWHEINETVDREKIQHDTL